VKRAVPPDVLAKYEQRQAEDVVIQAKITGLVRLHFQAIFNYFLFIVIVLNNICIRSPWLFSRFGFHMYRNCNHYLYENYY
jgi:hypothetical protein